MLHTLYLWQDELLQIQSLKENSFVDSQMPNIIYEVVILLLIILAKLLEKIQTPHRLIKARRNECHA
jgi:hypothetical protein